MISSPADGARRPGRRTRTGPAALPPAVGTAAEGGSSGAATPFAGGGVRASSAGAAEEVLDLRLAGLAAAAWLAALAGLRLAAGETAALAGVAAGLAAVLGLHLCGVLGRPTAPARRYGWIVLAALLGVVCGATATAARVAVRDAAPVRALVAARPLVTADLVVRDDPRPIRGVAGRPATLLLRADLIRLTDAEGHRLTGPVRGLVLATDPAWRTVLPGQRATARGRLAAPRGGDLTAAVLTAAGPPTRHGRPPWAQRAAGVLRAGLQRACEPLPDEPGGLLPGLVVGDTSRLPPAVEEDFRTTGMTHLNAVSGSNVAIIVGAVLLLARWARAGPRTAAGLCVLALVGFVILVRPSPSVVRAAAMGGIGLAALAAGRSRAALPALAAAVTVLVLVDPELAGNPGFTLSVCATGGLLLLAPGWRDALRRRGVPAGLAEALAVPGAAQLACGPVIAGLSGTVSLVAVPANLLAVPAVAPATVLGVAAAVVSPVWPAGAGLTAWLASWPARWLVLVAGQGARLPAGTVPWPGGVTGALLLAALSVALLFAVRRPLLRRLVAVGAVAVVLGTLPVRLLAPGWPPPGWVVVACAVGQGDAVVLPVAAGRAVVVDAGPDPSGVDGCLRRLGVREVPLLVVSHFHADHVGGIAGVFRGRRVADLVTPAWAEPPYGVAQVRAAARGGAAAPRTVSVGWRWRAGAVELAALGPPYPLRGSRSDPNNNSLVLAATVAGVRILLAGDAETEEQRALLEAGAPGTLRADVLKVAHHGSAYQDPEFLVAVRPAVALVSVGAGNDYGHPNGALLDRLRRGGARVLRTDTSGDVAAVRDGRGLAVVARGLGPGRRAAGPGADRLAGIIGGSNQMSGFTLSAGCAVTVLDDQARSGRSACEYGRRDPRQPASHSARSRRRGTARHASGHRSRRASPQRRPRRRCPRVPGRFPDGRRDRRDAQPFALRWPAGAGASVRPGRPQGPGRRTARLREEPGPRGAARGAAPRRGEGKGVRRRAARRGCDRCAGGEAQGAPGTRRLRTGRDPPQWGQVHRGRGGGADRRRRHRSSGAGRRLLPARRGHRRSDRGGHGGPLLQGPGRGHRLHRRRRDNGR